ncbi:MAG: hypothetical protein ACI9MR_001529 [Myxococcota bacterium]|jgi:hypothetical protein
MLMLKSMSAAATVALLATATMALSPACGGGARVLTPEEQAVKTAPPKPAGSDFFRDFAGEHVAAGEVFELDSGGRAVDGVGVVVSLEEVKTFGWSDAPQDDTDGTAIIRVERGTESVRVRVAADQVKQALGARLAVTEAKIAYDVARFKYLPKARLKVTAAE